MKKKKIFEIFEPLREDQAKLKLILGGSSSCGFYHVCGRTVGGCTISADCGDGGFLMHCEDADTGTCEDCIAYLAW